MSFELFARNVKYLFKYNLKHIYNRANDNHDHKMISNIIKMQENEKDLLNLKKRPHIMDVWETVNYLNNSNISYCRFGDGEFALMNDKKGGVFQKYDPRLADLLKKAFCSDNNILCVGLNYWFYHWPSNLHERQDIFYRILSKDIRDSLKPYIDFNRVYGDSLISMPYHLFKSFDFEKYYSEIEKLWKDKDIVIICGKTVFNKIKYNCFESAKSINYIYGKSVNAFDEYDALLEKALATDPKSPKFIILGQTATALAYDLAVNGHRGLDLGHLAKDFNAWKKQEPLNNDTIRDFYDKD